MNAMALLRGKWTAIGWVSLLLAAFFSLGAVGQYFFIRRELLKIVTADLRDNVVLERSAAALAHRFDVKEFHRARRCASCLLVRQNGSILDFEAEALSEGFPSGLLPAVEMSFPLERVFQQPTTVVSELGESWHLFGRRLDRGFVVIGFSQYDDIKQPNEKLVASLRHFGASLKEALKPDLKKLENALNWVVVDETGRLGAGDGRLPLRTNPLLVGKLPEGQSWHVATGKTYAVLREGLLNESGLEEATVVTWSDVSQQLTLLNHQLRYGAALAVFSWLVFFFFAMWYWRKAGTERRSLREAFQNYFSPQIMEAILKDPAKLGLGGQRREVTILFADIRSFTALSERLPPQTLTRMLQDYFTEMTDEVIANEGIVDKYIGDAIMAFWGAPIDQHDQADRAVRTAINMMGRLKKLQEKWAQAGYPLFDIGIGINLGLATVGNFGSTKRFDYTLIGDAVNAASRLEGLNKRFNTRIIISDSTRRQLTIPVNVRDLGEVEISGRDARIRVYQVEP